MTNTSVIFIATAVWWAHRSKRSCATPLLVIIFRSSFRNYWLPYRRLAPFSHISQSLAWNCLNWIQKSHSLSLCGLDPILPIATLSSHPLHFFIKKFTSWLETTIDFSDDALIKLVHHLLYESWGKFIIVRSYAYTGMRCRQVICIFVILYRITCLSDGPAFSHPLDQSTEFAGLLTVKVLWSSIVVG